MYLMHALPRYLKRVGTVGKIWKHENKDACKFVNACNMTFWYDILTWRDKFESNEAKWCILTLLCSTTFRGSDSATHPLPLHFLLQIWTFYFLLFWDEVYLSVDIAIHIWLSIYCSIDHSKSQLLLLYKPYFALDHFIGVNVVFEIIY